VKEVTDNIPEEDFAAKYSETRSDVDLDMMSSIGRKQLINIHSPEYSSQSPEPI
jgi:hypothetical protein